MKETEEDLRRRIGALPDAELVRLLKLEADERPVRELLVARDEARRRNLDLEAETLRPQPPPPPPLPPGKSWVFELTGAWEPERLYPLYSQVVILVAALVAEVGASLADLSGSPGIVLIRGLLVLASWIEVVHALYRLHSVLCAATEGRHPISPPLVILLNLIPCVNVIACFVWTGNVARFGEVNGRGQRSDRYLPALLFLGGLLLSRFNSFASVLLLLGSQWQLQARLLRAIGDRASSEVSRGDWSSGARV